MQSTMQRGALGIPMIARHVQQVLGRARVFTPDNPEGTPFATLAQRSARLAGALRQAGVAPGDVVATLCTATEEHLQAYLGVPGAGFVLHTINGRLHDDQIAYIIQHAGDTAVIADAVHLERLRQLLPACPQVKLLIVVGLPTSALPKIAGLTLHGYADFLAVQPAVEDAPDWSDLDEDAAAIVCYTSGTTGKPKGVAYSHRSLWLQAMSLCTANSLAIGSNSRVLATVPLYHVNGWGLPFAALMAGADIVLPGASLRAPDLLALIDRHKPTLAAGVPTIWADLLQEAQARQRRDLGDMHTIFCGGASVPNTLIAAYEALGINMFQAWGMTETSSMSAIVQMPPWAQTEEARAQYLATQGRVICGVQARVVDIADGTVLPADGRSAGEIQMRGPWVTARYLGGESSDSFDGAWLRTGDIGTLDGDGYITLHDRLKDAVKSGGEWIPSVALEQAIRTHTAIADVAVVATPDERWQERPAAIIVFKPGQSASAAQLCAWLHDRVARWWVPELWLTTDALPYTSVGKPDKKRMRQMLQQGEFAPLDTPG